MEHTANILNPKQGLITSLLNIFAMFQLWLFYDRHNEEGNVANAIAIRCSNYNKDIGLHLKDIPIEETITKLVLNKIFHHVGMSWIICPNKEMLYEIDEINNPDWLNKFPWYNTAICSEFCGKLFEAFIRQVRTDRYYLMCYIISPYKK